MKQPKKCPKCGSKNLSIDIGGQSGKYVCLDCGWMGVLALVDEDKHLRDIAKLSKKSR
ncbi:MAG: hypothetical protein ACP5E4_02735 [Candidatus Aenigmatarchaeota archaeon]